MKKNLFFLKCAALSFGTLLIFQLFACHWLYSSTSLSKTERLAGLAKVWGFLKYYHPEIATGNAAIDWHGVLFQEIAALENVKNDTEYYTLLNGLIEKADTVDCPSTTPFQKPDSLKVFNGAASIFEDNRLFDAATIAKMKQIYKRCIPESDLASDISGGNYFNAEVFKKIYAPNVTTRLAALVYYWNHIRYFFPHNSIADQDWDEVLMDFIPQFEAANDSISYHLCILKLTKKLDDTHAFIFDSPVLDDYWGAYFPPFYLSFVEGKTMVTSYNLDRRFLMSIQFRTYFSVDSLGKASGVKLGDEILAVDGVPIQELRDSLRQIVGSSNDHTLERNINGLVLRGKTASVQLTLSDGKSTLTAAIKRYRVPELQAKQSPIAAKPWRLLTPDIGYIDMARATAKNGQGDSIFQDFAATKAIIFDCRSYPSIGAFDLLPYLNESDTTQFAVFYHPYQRRAGYFYGRPYRTKPPQANQKPYQGQIVILINETTQSAGEYLTMQLQAASNREAMVVGSPSAGSDGMVSNVYFPGNVKTYYTGYGVFYPDGTPTQRVGIQPNVWIKPTIEGFRSQKDEILDKAVSLCK